jgi:hypothetical protein
MPEDVKVDKDRFNTLLRKMLDTPPLPKTDVKVDNPKPKKKQKRV